MWSELGLARKTRAGSFMKGGRRGEPAECMSWAEGQREQKHTAESWQLCGSQSIRSYRSSLRTVLSPPGRHTHSLVSLTVPGLWHSGGQCGWGQCMVRGLCCRRSGLPSSLSVLPNTTLYSGFSCTPSTSPPASQPISAPQSGSGLLKDR